MVYYLKQNGYSALHVVCGNINDVNIEDNNLIVNVYEDYSYNFIMEGNNINIITRALNWQELRLGLKIVKQEKILDKRLQDIAKLNQCIESQYLTIKGE